MKYLKLVLLKETRLAMQFELNNYPLATTTPSIMLPKTQHYKSTQ